MSLGFLHFKVSVLSFLAKVGFQLEMRGLKKVGRLVCEESCRLILSQSCSLKPVATANAGETELHIPVCKRDLNLAIWSQWSLQKMAQSPWPLVFHDDGSLERADCEKLKCHFPNCRITDVKEMDERAESLLKGYPNLLKYRTASRNSFGRKVIDAHFYSPQASILCIDTDVLFFAPPEELIELAGADDKVAYHCEAQDFYLNCPDLRKRFDSVLLDLNSGLTLRPPSYFDKTRFEEVCDWLNEEGERLQFRPGCDQLLLSICAGWQPSSNVKGLAVHYSNSAAEFSSLGEGLVSMHYHSWSREMFAWQGIPYFLKRLKSLE